MGRAKVQHWVPRFYLRHFATPETHRTRHPMVWLFHKDSGDPLLANVRNVAASSYLYTPRDAHGVRDWSMESRLENLESVLSRLWPSIAHGFVDLGDETIRKGLSLFVATLYLRHPSVLRFTAHSHRRLVAFFESFPKDDRGNPDVSETESRGELTPFDNSGWPEYRNAGVEELRAMFVRSIRSNAASTAKVLLAKRWSVVFSEHPVFITTDKPVMVVNLDRERFGLATPGTIVSISLSPTRVLTMDDMHDQPKGQYYPLGAHGPGPFNLTAWSGAERFMISSRHPDQVSNEMLEWADAQPPDDSAV